MHNCFTHKDMLSIVPTTPEIHDNVLTGTVPPEFDFQYRCPNCGKPFKSVGGFDRHQGSQACTAAAHGGKRLLFTPDDA